jgi:hypothetical protein
MTSVALAATSARLRATASLPALAALGSSEVYEVQR